MKTERELFLYELEGRGFIFKNKTWIHGLGDVGGLFDDDQLNMVWEMWCASASREGYKLVPVEPTRKMEMAGMNAGAGFVSKSIYKAMIGAAP
ncbi:MAG: hypothetical protein RIQ74_1137 [Pseudomonadota bacterium]|jgi:hypothetical protein